MLHSRATIHFGEWSLKCPSFLETSVDSGLGLIPRDEAAAISFTFIKPRINQSLLPIGQFSIVEPIRTVDLCQ